MLISVTPHSGRIVPISGLTGDTFCTRLQTMSLAGGKLFDDTTVDFGDEGSINIIQTDEFGESNVVVLSNAQLRLITMFLLRERLNDNDNKLLPRQLQHQRQMPCEMRHHS